ncbi:MAG: thiamine pyrophosphate-dependent dehydrogenase E1 component subunit alpha, partial [Thermodesulfobacteriota bacterium]
MKGSIKAEEMLWLYRTMCRIRAFETKVQELFAANKIPGFVHLSIGEEAVAAGVSSVLRADDYITSTHRGHGHVLAKGADPRRMMAELFGKRTGYCKGKGGSMHIADFSVGVLGANGVVAGGLPIAVGAGLSCKLRATDQVVVCYFGDGASNRGPVHEAMNMASIWRLPILFTCENNQYASTTAMSYSTSVERIALRAAGYSIPGVTVDGNDVLAVREAAADAVARARRGEGPTLLEALTYRWRGHFEGDPQRYRTKAEVEEAKLRDPMSRLASILRKKKILPRDLEKRIQREAEEEIEAAVRFAEEGPYPDPHEALEDLYAGDVG